jgi:hypothetical protein
MDGVRSLLPPVLGPGDRVVVEGDGVVEIATRETDRPPSEMFTRA